MLQFKNIIISHRTTKAIKMEKTMIQKSGADALFSGTKLMKLVSYLSLEFNSDFIHEWVSFLYAQRHCL